MCIDGIVSEYSGTRRVVFLFFIYTIVLPADTDKTANFAQQPKCSKPLVYCLDSLERSNESKFSDNIITVTSKIQC